MNTSETFEDKLATIRRRLSELLYQFRDSESTTSYQAIAL
jgi:hypothetical protein